MTAPKPPRVELKVREGWRACPSCGMQLPPAGRLEGEKWAHQAFGCPKRRDEDVVVIEGELVEGGPFDAGVAGEGGTKP